MMRLLLMLAGFIALILFLFWVGQRGMLYLPSGEAAREVLAGFPGGEAVTFPTEDGLTLHGWFIPALASATGDVVIVFNGNAGNRAFRSDLARGLAEHGIAVLLFDYRGYGGNPGAPSEVGLTRDARAARRFLESRRGIDSRRISYFGESLGAGVAVNLALEQPPRALILRSPWTSLADTARYHFPYLPVRWLLRDRFSSVDNIARIRCPLLIVTAAHDSIVPSEQSRRLFQAAAEPKRLLIVEGADHNDLELVAGPRVVGAAADLLKQSR
jgi:fermentation-respiration switch protein FrsA (DUF1100 family)